MRTISGYFSSNCFYGGVKVKKIISLVLVCVLLLSVAIPAIAVDDSKCDCNNPPIVYVVGRADVYLDPNAEELTPAITVEIDKVLNVINTLHIPFAKGMLLNQWDDYCDALVNGVGPFFEEYTLDKDGNVKNDSGILQKWSEEDLYDNHLNPNVHDYTFYYDPRLDPWEIADDLNRYIEAVEKITGHEQVSLLSRCMGTGIAMAYLVKYASHNNYADIHNFVLFNGTLNGMTIINEAFTGKVSLDYDGIERYAADLLGTDLLGEFLKATVTLFNRTNGLDAIGGFIEDIYGKIYTNVVPRLLLETYGGIPGYWSMLGADYYDEARKFVFGGREEEYSVLLEKLDRYNEKVQKNIDSTLLEMDSLGIPVAVIAKYGFQNAPIVESSEVESDGTVDLYSQSFGAASVKMDTPLSDEYLANAEKNGNSKYISPDNQVDASTCLFPDSTWFIKDLTHYSFPLGVDEFLVDICRFDGKMTVQSDAKYPQYMRYYEDTDTILPMTEENCQSRYEDYNVFTSIKYFFQSLFALIGDSVKK